MKRNPYVAFSLPLFLWTLSCGDSAPEVSRQARIARTRLEHVRAAKE